MNIWQTIAYRNPQGTLALTTSHGFAPANDTETLAQQLAALVASTQDDEILDQVRALHPDRDFFQDLIQNKEKIHNCCGNMQNIDGYKECAGCGGKCGEKRFLNAEGPLQTNQNIPQYAQHVQGIMSNNATTMLTLIGIVAITAMAVMAFKKS